MHAFGLSRIPQPHIIAMVALVLFALLIALMQPVPMVSPKASVTTFDAVRSDEASGFPGRIPPDYRPNPEQLPEPKPHSK